MRTGKPFSAEQIRSTISSQKRDILLIEYFVTKNQTIVFAISKDIGVRVETIPLMENDIKRYVANFQREVVQYPNFKNIGSSWVDISKYLMDPLRKLLNNNQLIYFIPHGLLHYLPLHAMELNCKPLIKSHPVAYSPSTSLLKYFLNKETGSVVDCACFGVDFEEEAKDISEMFNKGLFKTKPILGAKATKKEFFNKQGAEAIHFSCHGIFNKFDPLSSGVKLYDGILTAREIYNIRLNAQLVTLSACQTGINERTQGDELIGLTRSFIYAGASSVVVSLWPVNPISTKKLMLEFYAFLRNGKDKAVALQEAQKKLIDEYSHPYYWAPFTLVGHY